MNAPPLQFAAEIDFKDSQFVDLGLHETQAGVLPLVHVRDGVVKPLGTCFSVTNDGLCMTARHVIEEGVRILEAGQIDLDKTGQGFFGALHVSSLPNEDNPERLLGGLLPMFRVHLNDALDIALIKLNLPIRADTGRPLRFPAHQLRLSFPGVGEPFFGLGYRTMNWRSLEEDGHYNVGQTYSATRGQVEELHAGGRDRGMLPFPCFRTSARFDGGMSGGPLIDHFGRVFGVICSSFGHDGEAEDHISYGSLIGPAMGMTLDITDMPGGPERKAFLWDLVDGGAIAADKRGVELERGGERLRMMIGQSLTLDAQLGT